MKAMRNIISALVALLLAAAPAQSAAPKIGCAVEVGVPASGGTLRPVVFLKFIDNAEPGPAYRIYWKAGAPNAAGSYTLLSTIMKTSDPVMLGHLLNLAAAAGVSMASLDVQLSVIVGGEPAAGASLRENSRSSSMQTRQPG